MERIDIGAGLDLPAEPVLDGHGEHARQREDRQQHRDAFGGGVLVLAAVGEQHAQQTDAGDRAGGPDDGADQDVVVLGVSELVGDDAAQPPTLVDALARRPFPLR
jgi:hypothetical protein